MLSGGLFTRDFLIEGVRGTVAWQRLDDASLVSLQDRLKTLFASFGNIKNPNESETEKELIWPLLEAIGWADMSVQQNLSVKRRDDVPDALLFPSADAKQTAMPLPAWQRFQHGVCVVEAKRWNRLLDRAEARQPGDEGVPSTQMLRYLRRVDDVTNGALRWGILTNGRHWRLYFRGALSVAEDFLEIDLGKLLDLPGCERDLLDKRPDQFADDAEWHSAVLKLFLLIFGRGGFLPEDRGETFHTLALREGKQWEARVARDLADTVFRHVFPALARAMAAADGKNLDASYLEEVRDGALVLLYRVLFVLYAEDRNLLPDETGPYADYSLTRLRLEIAERRAKGAPFSDRMTTFWSRLQGIFQAIGQGDDGLGIPPYNGGLFDPAAAPILSRVELPDSIVAEFLFRMSHADLGDGRPKYINYRDLSVQQLGSVYERILEHGLKAEDGQVSVAESPAARKGSGSYYTPEELVKLIIERAIGPLVTERVERFAAQAALLADNRRATEARIAELTLLDPASLLLDLKICDPAMGSGHFLVSLVDWLSDRVLEAMAEATAAVSFALYVSPLAARIEAIRAKILAEAKAHGWPILESQLDDRHIVRRMVLKRVVYGIDKNPMAVELAKVALWLHSFTVGAPLSFLDHHLRCGDSILGAWARPTLDALRARGALFNVGVITRVEQVAGLMAEIEETTDNDIAEVAQSKSKFGAVEEVTQPVAAFFSLLTAEKLMGVFERAPKKAPLAAEKMTGKSAAQVKRWRSETTAFEAASALQLALEGAFGDPLAIAAGEAEIAPPDLVRQIALLPAEEIDPQTNLFPGIGMDDRRRALADRLVNEARGRAARHGFFHWEIGFPNVWSNLVSVAPDGGFDAVIGNPPYVRQGLLGDEAKRALKPAYASFDGMADLYVYFFEQGLRLLRPGGRLSYVVTNKWLRAGYAEALRGLFATEGQVEFVADFGHAKHFFPDADVFPSIVVLRKPLPGEDAMGDAQICVIPRDAVPEKGLSAAVAAATYPLPRACFTKESWTLEPPDVMALLDKIRRNGVPLAEYTTVKSYRGVTTGLNEAFFLDTPTRNRLVAEDPGCAEIIRPYLRGQDIERWYAPWDRLWMIFARRGINIEAYPSVLRHLQGFRDRLEPKPSDWEPSGPEEIWKGRKEGLYRWYEIQDSTEYFIEFEKPKIIYQAIQFYPSYAFDTRGMLLSNKAFFLPVDDTSLISVLNSPIGWWIAWRHFLHMKDEALSNDGVKLATFSVPVELSKQSQEIALHAVGLPSLAETIHSTTQLIHDWLRHEFGLDRPGRRLAQPHTLSSDEFIASVRAALAKNRKLTSAEIARLKEEHAGTVEPAREAAAEMLTHERALSDLVNAAYGLTPQEVGLMWRTAPPPHAARSPDGTTPARCGQLAPEAADTALRKATALESFCFVLICRTEMRCGSGDVTVK